MLHTNLVKTTLAALVILNVKKLLKFRGAIFLIIWVGQAIQQTNNVNVRSIELIEEANPDAKIEYLSSDLSFFDVLFTVDHEWTAIWEVDGKRKRVRWSREYNQPVPLGLYFGMGTAWLKMVEMRDQ